MPRNFGLLKTLSNAIICWPIFSICLTGCIVSCWVRSRLPWSRCGVRQATCSKQLFEYAVSARFVSASLCSADLCFMVGAQYAQIHPTPMRTNPLIRNWEAEKRYFIICSQSLVPNFVMLHAGYLMFEHLPGPSTKAKLPRAPTFRGGGQKSLLHTGIIRVW